ncbi:MAG: hypothetical protein ABI700_11850 [Chloroflexota bacterium]
MDKLSDLYQAINRLNRDEFRELRTYVNQHVEPPQIVDEDPRTRAAALMAAVENFWEGMSQQEIDEIVAAMNSEYIEPIDPTDYAWLDKGDEA